MNAEGLNDYWSIQRAIKKGVTIDELKYPWLDRKYSRELNDIESLIYQARHTYEENKSAVGFLVAISETLLSDLKEKYE